MDLSLESILVLQGAAYVVKAAFVVCSGLEYAPHEMRTRDRLYHLSGKFDLAPEELREVKNLKTEVASFEERERALFRIFGLPTPLDVAYFVGVAYSTIKDGTQYLADRRWERVADSIQ
jgi:hypothetical protein